MLTAKVANHDIKKNIGVLQNEDFRSQLRHAKDFAGDKCLTSQEQNHEHNDKLGRKDHLQETHINKACLEGITQMNIKEFSEISGISAYTLRYYEKIGIFQKINRNDSGHRDFSEKDISWAEFITRLKETGMPLEQIKKYAALREQGEHTAEDRMKLLLIHAATLMKKISAEKQHLNKIHEKIRYYEKILTAKIPLDLE